MLKKKTQSGAQVVPKNVGKDSAGKAFTLPEVIVAMSVLIMVVVASTNLLVSIIRNNNDNINSLVAFELAQQGIEGMRNVRDSNWLLGADFKGMIQKNSVWGGALPDLNSTQYYTLDLKESDPDFCKDTAINSATIANCAPWSLNSLGGDQPKNGNSATLLYKQGDSLVKYVHAQSDLPSPFHRYLKVESVAYALPNGQTPKNPNQVLKYRVTAVVDWTESGRDREVSLTTELTDWKGGPL